MGRSVLTHPYAVTTAIVDFDNDRYHDGNEECTYDCDHTDEFLWEIENLRDDLVSLFPSFAETDTWEYNEIHIVARNTFAKVGISEYCGRIAISLIPVTDADNYIHSGEAMFNLGTHWINQVTPKFLSAVAFSN